MALLTTIVFDALSYGATLFLLSIGLTVVFGVLRILNISHGGIYALGAYMGTWLALWVLGEKFSPWMTYPALLLGAIFIGITVDQLSKGSSLGVFMAPTCIFSYCSHSLYS